MRIDRKLNAWPEGSSHPAHAGLGGAGRPSRRERTDLATAAERSGVGIDDYPTLARALERPVVPVLTVQGLQIIRTAGASSYQLTSESLDTLLAEHLSDIEYALLWSKIGAVSGSHELGPVRTMRGVVDQLGRLPTDDDDLSLLICDGRELLIWETEYEKLWVYDFISELAVLAGRPVATVV